MTSSRVLGFVSLTAALLAAAPAAAETHHPYAGQEKRGIKALSDVEIGDLMAGRGMGLARAAELNGFPGPMHVLEHEKALSLTQAQRAAIAGRIQAARAELAKLAGLEDSQAVELPVIGPLAEVRLDHLADLFLQGHLLNQFLDTFLHLYLLFIRDLRARGSRVQE